MVGCSFMVRLPTFSATCDGELALRGSPPLDHPTVAIYTPWEGLGLRKLASFLWDGVAPRIIRVCRRHPNVLLVPLLFATLCPIMPQKLQKFGSLSYATQTTTSSSATPYLIVTHLCRGWLMSIRILALRILAKISPLASLYMLIYSPISLPSSRANSFERR
jgi:hypothetical protein